MGTLSEELSYSIGEKEDVIIVLFSGKIREQDVPLLDQLFTEFKDKPQPIIIFDFKKVYVFSHPAHEAFGRILKAIRAANKIAGISDLHVDFRNTMLHAGFIRETEVFKDVSVAWKNLKRLYEALQDGLVPANSKKAA